jgi:hypothetical protein
VPKPVRDLLPGHNGSDGLLKRTLAFYSDAANDTTWMPKFRAPENLKLVVAGGTVGRFSALIPGWLRKRLDDARPLVYAAFPCQVREILGLNQLQESVPNEKIVVPITKSMLQFIQIGVKVLNAHLVVRADRAFQKAPDAFDAVGMDVTARPLFGAVVDRLLAGVGV